MPLTCILALLLCAPPVATASGSSAPLTPDGDNAPAIQALIDSMPNGSTIRLPAGLFHVDSPLNLKPGLKLHGAGMDATRIKSRGTAWTGGVVNFAHPQGIEKTNGVQIHDLTVEQAVSGPTTHTCIQGNGDDIVMRRVRIKGSRYEGFVVGGWSKRVTVEDCVADDCGNGGPAYTQSTAAWNSHAIDTTYRRCKTTGSGQGHEVSNTRVLCEDCQVTDPGAGRPSIAFNVGSAGAGVYDVRIVRARTAGYPAAVQTGNGIGKLSKVRIEGCTFIDGSINFMGGQPTNNTPHPDEGPDTFGSSATANTFVFTAPCDGGITYYGGPTAAAEVYGREPFDASRNTFHFVLQPGQVQSAPIIGVAGKVKKVSVGENWIHGLTEAPSRGDIATFTVQLNGPPFPGCLTHKGNRAIEARALVVKVEGAP